MKENDGINGNKEISFGRGKKSLSPAYQIYSLIERDSEIP